MDISFSPLGCENDAWASTIHITGLWLIVKRHLPLQKKKKKKKNEVYNIFKAIRSTEMVG